MGGFFQELAKVLAQRWVSLLALPGAFFIAAAWLAVSLGHSRAWDHALLVQRVNAATTTLTKLPVGLQVLGVVALLAAAAGVGLVVQALAGVTRRLWLGQWPHWLAAPLVRRRRARWHRLVAKRRRLEEDSPEPRAQVDHDRIDAAADRVNRMAMAEPGRPTWMGDRVHAVESVALHRGGLDLAFGWPRLWLLLPETTRTELGNAHAAFAAAVATGTWAVPYLLLGTSWWPAALMGVATGVTGWARARSAITDLSSLAEAAVDLHGRELAAALGVVDPEGSGPLTVAEGERATNLMRKGR
ncbi:hypothetical protein SK803_16685 [Lentzea sp. BCCO 10_0856]|uniref:Vegetative cell wall protein gp1 n=1 Tax=Lentzea miocenica TaxID=3095431 RepID=A0ABU4T128_9PSEU|nr:hypothetical protein [Lentzea sp. BCCO 10_0856]MDX8031863.1 hypothetical protein [Lentzea sp. BCCO 10_0856]